MDPIKVTLEVAGRRYEADLATQTRVPADADGLSQALADGPGLFAWWASLEAWALGQEEAAKKAKETCYAELYTFYEASLSRSVEDKREKPTVDRVRSAVVMDRRYQVAWDSLIKASEAAGLAKAGRRGMEERREHLLELARNYRAELETQLRDAVKAMRGFARSRA